jgi:hypothetical protein
VYKSGDVEIRMLGVCIIREVLRKQVLTARRDIHAHILAISWFNLWNLFVNKHKTAQPSSCITTRHLINNKPQVEIWNSR